MKKQVKYLIRILILTVLLTSYCLLPVYAAATNAEEQDAAAQEPEIPESYNWPIQSNELKGWPQGPKTIAETAIVMEASSGTILYNKNMDEKRFPASITKIMTTLLALENASMDEQVIFSENAIWGIERDSTHIGIKIGEILTMEQCLYGILLGSANEVSYAVAEHIGGSMESFVAMMNKKAKELGCTNTNFVNSHGLHDDNHYTTAHDMALISQAAMKNEQFRQITGSAYYVIPATNITDEERWIDNHHKMLPNKKYQYEGCIGGKTGYTSVAGNTLVTFASWDGMELISVVMKDAGVACYTDSRDILNYGFAEFQKILIENAKTVTSTKILDSDRPYFLNSVQQTIGIAPNDTYGVIPKNATAENITSTVTAEKYFKKTDYYFNSVLIATSAMDISRALPSPPLIKTAGSFKLVNTDGKTALRIAASFDDLPLWKYPLLGIVCLAIIFYIITFIIHLNRKSKKKKSQIKDAAMAAGLVSDKKPFLSENTVPDENLLKELDRLVKVDSAKEE